MPGSPPVVVDQGEPLRQLLEDPVQKRVLPFHPQIAERHPRNENHRGAITGDRESQAHTIRAARIAYPRSGYHGPTLSPWHEPYQDISTAPVTTISCSDPAHAPISPATRHWRPLLDMRRSPKSVPVMAVPSRSSCQRR